MIYVENLPEGENPKAEVEKAVHNYFAYRAKLNRREFKHMMKQGRMSLLIGLTFLTICLLMGNLIMRWADAPLSSLLREAFLIAGWVAMWRPMQIYLYDWWPLRRRGQIFEKMNWDDGRLKADTSLKLRHSPPVGDKTEHRIGKGCVVSRRNREQGQVG